jgi:hypothetical protein
MSNDLGIYKTCLRGFGRVPRKLEKIIDEFIDYHWLYARMNTYREQTRGRVHRLSNAYIMDDIVLSTEKSFD